MLLAVLTAISSSISSCRRWSDNGKIDGYWQIQEIYYTADGTTVHPTNLFIAVQLELLQLQDPDYSPKMTAVLSYDKKQDYFSVDFRYNPTEKELYKFGFAAPQSVIHIDEANRNKLVLSSSIAIIKCRKF